MNHKRAQQLNYQCPLCTQEITKVGIRQHYGCLNPQCQLNYHQVAYRIRLGLLPKNAL